MMDTARTTWTPVYVLTGFLGSGKTTLLNALLKDASFANTAVIVNEFGEIGLDHLLIEQSSDNVVLLEAGCLCCTIADSLHETLADLHYRRVRGEVPAFDRVIIETTGLADPAPILNTLLGNRLVTDHYRLESVIVTVDARNVLAGLRAHREVAKQIAVADCLVVTKLDVVQAPPELEPELRRVNPVAPILQSRTTGVAGSVFRSARKHDVTVSHLRAMHAVNDTGALGNDFERESIAHRGHDADHHGTRIRADAFILAKSPSWSGLTAWWRVMVELCGDRLLRCKGLLQMADSGEIVFVQGVQTILHSPERLRAWPSDDHRSRLVVITREVEAAQLQLTIAALELPGGSDAHVSLHDLQRNPVKETT